MTEEEWLACEDPKRLATEVHDWLVCGSCGKSRRRWARPCRHCGEDAVAEPRFSARKYRLIGCACCRFIWDGLASDNQRRSVEVAERFAEGKATADELRRAWQQAAPPGATTASQYENEPLLRTVAQVVARMRELNLRGLAPPATDQGLCDVIRDLVGNPFRPVVIDLDWLVANGEQAQTIAEDIDAEGRFDELPVLADSLEDAGCSDERILEHARQPRHYRGCWLLDAILGKT